MTKHAFHAELSLLKETAAEFALANPALAPALRGDRTDPDVERLLEAMAFQNALLRRKLDLDFPAMVQALTQSILPHYLRPIPATTIFGFTTHGAYGRSATIPAGSQFGSSPAGGTGCRFRTTADLELQPVELTDASFSPRAGRGGELRLSLALKDLPLSRWQPRTVRFFLAGEYALATDLYLLLSRHVSRILLTAEDGGACVELPADCLVPAGFADEEGLSPYPEHAFPSYRLLQEYFSTPERFLFFDLGGWERWRQRGEGMSFSVVFELDGSPRQPGQVRRESFILNAVPAVNLFAHDAEPISVDPGTGLYRIRPAGAAPNHQIFSVDRVTGYCRETDTERSYFPYQLFRDGGAGEPVYQTTLAPARLHGGYEVELCLVFPGETAPATNETLSIELTCSNGSLPESLCIGDISLPLSALPDFVSARNITPINPGQDPPLGDELLRRLIAHLRLNHLSLATAENLRAMLELYVFPEHGHGDRSAAVLKRISGIEDLLVSAGQQMIAGVAVRGSKICITVREDRFAGAGDMYLFGCLLDNFFGSCAVLNGYTQLEFQGKLRGGTWQWPIRLGQSQLP